VSLKRKLSKTVISNGPWRLSVLNVYSAPGRRGHVSAGVFRDG